MPFSLFSLQNDTDRLHNENNISPRHMRVCDHDETKYLFDHATRRRYLYNILYILYT